MLLFNVYILVLNSTLFQSILFSPPKSQNVEFSQFLENNKIQY